MIKTSEFKGFTIELSDQTAVLTFTRPEIRNPLSINVIESIKTAIAGLESDAKVEGLVITGTGKTFASGADLKEVALLDSDEAFEFAKQGQNLMSMITKSRLTTIAAINGFCMGGALDLALACDRRISSKDACFSHPGVSLGLITGWGGTQMLPSLIGLKNAYDMFLTAKRIDAVEALRIGLIDEIANDPVAQAIKYAEKGK